GERPRARHRLWVEAWLHPPASFRGGAEPQPSGGTRVHTAAASQREYITDRIGSEDKRTSWMPRLHGRSIWRRGQDGYRRCITDGSRSPERENYYRYHPAILIDAVGRPGTTHAGRR